MRIAIGSKGQTMKDEISEVCGRAPYFLIIENNELQEAIKNPFAIGGGGAGAGVAKMLIDKGVEMVICGKFGPNMTMWLEDKGVAYKEINRKTVEEIIKEL